MTLFAARSTTTKTQARMGISSRTECSLEKRRNGKLAGLSGTSRATGLNHPTGLSRLVRFASFMTECARSTAMSRLQFALDQIVFASNYTCGFLEQTKTNDWFRIPAAGISHIGWQIGHLAFAKYRMGLWRIRG